MSRADLEAQGRTIVGQRGGRWTGASGMCRCPAHDDRDPSLSVRVGETTLLFHCFAGCATVDVLRALRALPAGATAGGRLSVATEPASHQAISLQPIAARLWQESRPLGGSLAARYLSIRGLVSHSAQLRFHPRVQRGPRRLASFHPALLAAVRDDAGLVAVHRTFLDPATAGKAQIDSPKMLLGNPGSGAVRIGEATSILGLAEGLETAIAACLMHRIPVWAVLGNERFGTVNVPAHVERLVILADNDAGGRRAAGLAQRLQHPGRTIETLWPPAPHNDWADAWQARAGRTDRRGSSDRRYDFQEFARCRSR